MVLDLCVESYIRLFFVLIKVFVDHWGTALTIIALGVLLSRFPFVLGLLGDVFNFLGDALTSLLAGTFIGGIITGGITALGLGIIWAALVLTSHANPVLRIAAAPFAFLAGALYGLVPIPLPTPVTTLLDYALKQPALANFVCFVPLVLLIISGIFLQVFLGQGLCEFLNSALTTLF